MAQNLSNQYLEELQLRAHNFLTTYPMKQQDLASNLVSGAIGSIPGVGAFLSGIFNGITGFFGANEQEPWQQAVEQLYDDLAQEVENLKKYVDGAIVELKVEIVEQQLGGLLRVIDTCQVYTIAEDMVDCMKRAI